MISLEKHGREVDQRTKEEWVRAASVSTSRDNCLVVRVGGEEEGVTV